MDHRNEKTELIRKFLSELYCFNSNETASYFEKLQTIQPNGLDELIKLLKGAKKQQDLFLAQKITQDKTFFEDLSHFLKTKTGQIKHEYEAQEKNRADNILDQL